MAFKKKAAGMAAVLLASLSMITTCVQAYAAEPSVTWKEVSQGINSSNQYVYDGSKTATNNVSGLIVKKGDEKWGYIKNGIVGTSISGVYGNINGFWCVKNGWVDFSVTGVSKAPNGNWYSFGGGKRVFADNGTVMNNSNGWWYITDGYVDFTYSGFASNQNGSWWVGELQHDGYDAGGSGGQVNFSANGVEKDTTGALGISDTWYYIVGGKVQYEYTGVSNYKNSNGWWYIKNGKVDFTYTGIAANNNGSWYVSGGKVDLSKSGTVTYNGMKYTVSGGKVTGISW